jgi:threonine synthase
MRYVSTRGQSAPRDFSTILLAGLADDGGLFVPESYPRLTADELTSWRAYSYPQLALALLSRFAPEIDDATWRALIGRTYTAARFGSEAITPLSDLGDGIHLLHLSNGPTLAFKDLAMQLLGNLFEAALAKDDATLSIVGATSGDTGSAAEEAMRGKRGIGVFMLTPHGRMSPFQAAQMYSIDDPNIHNLAVRGVFDDCQDLVKAINNDLEFKARHRIGAVNSINWARLVAQVVYYFKGYFAATRSNDQAVQFCVPSGNFGNVFAGYVARELGLPIARLIVATNENDVLDEFFRTGAYRPRGAAQVHATTSPSMDISRASNFERFAFDLCGRDPATVRRWFSGGGFDLTGSPLLERLAASGFVSGRSSHSDRIETIRRVHARRGILVDPHTADGLKVAASFVSQELPTICLETALPAKFAGAIREALGIDPPRPSAFVGLEERPQRFTLIDADIDAVKDAIDAARPGVSR